MCATYYRGSGPTVHCSDLKQPKARCSHGLSYKHRKGCETALVGKERLYLKKGLIVKKVRMSVSPNCLDYLHFLHMCPNDPISCAAIEKVQRIVLRIMCGIVLRIMCGIVLRIMCGIVLRIVCGIVLRIVCGMVWYGLVWFG